PPGRDLGEHDRHELGHASRAGRAARLRRVDLRPHLLADDALADPGPAPDRARAQPRRRGASRGARPKGAERLMGGYIVRRLLSGVVLVFAITLVTFAVFRLIPQVP